MDADQQQDNWKPPSAQEIWLPPSAKPIDTSAQSSQPQSRGLLSGIEDMYHGLVQNMRNSADASSSPAGLQRFDARNTQNQQNLLEHPIKGLIGLTGLNPDQTWNDIKSGNIPASIGDIIPPVLMGGLGLLHGKLGGEPTPIPQEAPAIVPEVLPREAPIPARPPLQLDRKSVV